MKKKTPSLEALIVPSTMNEGLLTLKVFDKDDGNLHCPKKYLELAGFRDGDKVMISLVPKAKKKAKRKK